MSDSVGRLLSVAPSAQIPTEPAKFWQAILGLERHHTHPDWATIARPVRWTATPTFQQSPR